MSEPLRLRLKTPDQRAEYFHTKLIEARVRIRVLENRYELVRRTVGEANARAARGDWSGKEALDKIRRTVKENGDEPKKG